MSRKRPCTFTMNISEGPELLKEIQDTAKGLKMPVSRLLIGLYKGDIKLHDQPLETDPTEAQP